MTYRAAQIAELVGGTVQGDGSIILTGFAAAGVAKPGDLTFAENEIYFQRAEQSAAAAILVDGDFQSSKKVLIKVPHARIGFAKALTLFFPAPSFPSGVHPTAVLAPSAQVDPTAYIGPNCVIGEHVKIGSRAVLQGLVYVGEGSEIGEESHICPNVTIYSKTIMGKRVTVHSGSVIGSDGFGYVYDNGAHRKIPQVGNVQLHDDVEIGANVTIDRGALGPTIIGRGTKIDNLVQIAHNVVIGENSLVVAQTGIAGSTRLGNYVTVAGQVGIAGHLKIGNKVTIAAQSGVMHDIPEGQKWFGTPAQPDRKMKRQLLTMQQLPDLLRRMAELERRFGIEELDPSLGSEKQ